MSHGSPRKENICLNCNAAVSYRYCGVCGQENIEPREKFLQLVTHFTYDVFHYDGKFFSTLKVLLFKPGLLTHEYVRGKRTAYLHPVRMYIFISAMFFIIFLSFIMADKDVAGVSTKLSPFQQTTIQSKIDELKDSLAVTSDSDKRQAIQNEIFTLQQVPVVIQQSQKDIVEANIDSAKTTGIDEAVPSSLKEYEAAQAQLSPQQKDGWLKHTINTKKFVLNEKLKYDTKGFIDAVKEHYLHSLTSMMFISLPFAALIFLLLYAVRKKYTYVQHGVFALHIYSAVFIFILLVYALYSLQNIINVKLFAFLSSISILAIFYYIYKAMRNFYEQGRWKTIFKFLLFLILESFVLVLLTSLFLITSLIQAS